MIFTAGGMRRISGRLRTARRSNCLRSHVNLTETELALAMITRAGMPSNRIFVGEATYAAALIWRKPDATAQLAATGTNHSSTQSLVSVPA